MAQALPAGQAKLAANWIMGEVAATLNKEEKDIADAPVQAPALAALINRIIDGTISNKIAREVFGAMWAGENGGQPDAIIEARGLKQISDTGAIGAMIDEVLAANAAIVEEYRAGKQKAFNSLVGQIMKAARGKATRNRSTTCSSRSWTADRVSALSDQLRARHIAAAFCWPRMDGSIFAWRPGP